MIFTTNQEAVARYLLHTFEDFDTIELRLIRKSEVQRYWTTPIEFDGLLDVLDTANRQGFNIYVGPNPRKEKDKSGDNNVLLARNLFADFDGLAGDAAAMLAEVDRRIEKAKLPEPTMLIFSGHGIHAYWKLIGPITDLALWTRYQKGLIRALNSDRSIHNPERIMRLPGFANWKAEPVDCYIVDREGDKTPVELSRFPRVLQDEPKPVETPRPIPAAAANSGDALDRAQRWADAWPGVGEGQRNAEAFRHSAALRKDFALSEPDSMSLLQRWNQKNVPPLNDSELQAVLRSGDKHGKNPIGSKLLERPKARTIRISPSCSEGGNGDGKVDLLKFNRTDSSMAELFAIWFGNQFRFNDSRGRWGIDSKGRWDFERGEPVARQAVVRMSRKLRDIAIDIPDRSAWEDFCRSMENHNRISNILAEARNYVPIICYASDFDVDDYLFNVANGTIDLRTGTLRPHNPADMLTKQSPVVYDPSATCERFDRFLLEIMSDNEGMADFLLRVLGMCLTGDISEQILLIFWGEGSNGKTVLLDIIKYVMGDHAGDAAPELLIQKFNQEHPTEIADLQSRRLVVCSESEKRARLRVQFMKRLTGDSTLKARYMRQDYFEFRRTHKLVLVTNNAPTVDEDSEAAWRRIRLVPFTRTFSDLERDTRLIEKLRVESSGILNRLIQGCLAWQRNGLGYPAEVVRATSDYRKSQNPLDDFLAERTEVDPAGSAAVAALSESYKSWCACRGIDPVPPRDFNGAMLTRGYSKSSIRDGDRVFKAWEGLVLC